MNIHGRVSHVSRCELTVTEICSTLELPQANVSQHLGIFRDKCPVRSYRQGRFVHYSLSSPKIMEAMDLPREVMAERLVVTTPTG